jgi:hypothetical protein
VTDDLRKMGIRGWTERARNGDQWRLIIKEAKAPRVCSAGQKKKNFFLLQKITDFFFCVL